MPTQLGRPALKRQITIYDAWVTRAYNLAPGEQLFIPCDDKQEQKEVIKILNDALQRGPLDLALSIRVSPTFRDKRLWVQITKKVSDRSVGFKKFQHSDGTWAVEREALGTTTDRIRSIQAAVEDGLSLEEIEEMFGTALLEIERKMFFPDYDLPEEAYHYNKEEDV